uniref:VWFA domain-containing protein n=1 Tax=Plectus sambesii TaxID=2011161 RepID=A0A914X9G8_9BILA
MHTAEYAIFLALASASLASVDYTMVPGARGPAVVEAALSKITNACLFDRNYDFMRLIAAVQTRFGLDMTFPSGIWALSQLDFNQTKYELFFGQGWQQLMTDINVTLNVDYSTVRREDGSLLKPLVGALATRLFFETLNDPIPVTLTKQAFFWKAFYQTASSKTTLVSSDVLFILDSSLSIGVLNWKLMTTFVKNMVDMFPVNEQAYKFAVDLFADTAITGIAFNNYSSVDDFKRMVDRLPFEGLLTDTEQALYLAANESFSAAHGGRNTSLGFARNALLITDGNPRHMHQTKAAALYAKQKGLVLTIIGIGAYIDKKNMLEIASFPSCARVNMIPDFEPLATEDFSKHIRAQLCLEGSVEESVTTISNAINGSKWFMYRFAARVDQGISLRVQVDVGSVVMFLSTTIVLPNEAAYDMYLVSSPGSTGQVYVGPELLKKAPKVLDLQDDQRPVFAALLGREEQNAFRIDLTPGEVSQSNYPQTASTAAPPVPTEQNNQPNQSTRIWTTNEQFLVMALCTFIVMRGWETDSDCN